MGLKGGDIRDDIGYDIGTTWNNRDDIGDDMWSPCHSQLRPYVVRNGTTTAIHKAYWLPCRRFFCCSILVLLCCIYYRYTNRQECTRHRSILRKMLHVVAKPTVSSPGSFSRKLIIFSTVERNRDQQTGFYDFVFKIRLIRLGFSFQNSKIPVFELTTYWFPVRSHNHYTNKQSQLWVGDTETLQSCLTNSNWIELILLIRLI